MQGLLLRLHMHCWLACCLQGNLTLRHLTGLRHLDVSGLEVSNFDLQHVRRRHALCRLCCCELRCALGTCARHAQALLLKIDGLHDALGCAALCVLGLCRCRC